MKKILLTIILLFLLGGVSLAGVFYWQNLRGIGPVINPPQQNIADIISSPKPGTNTTGLPLQLPPGFSVSIFAKDLGSPRVMLPLDYGYMLVSIPAQGKVVALKDDNADGVSDHMYTVLTGLDQPHGLAMYYHGEMTLYIAESDQVSTYDFDFDNQKATNKKKVLDLPGGGGHFTRTLLIIQTPGGEKLLTSIGSSCNVCNEQDDRRAKVLISSLDGSDMRTYASGLRNAVFLTTHPTTKQAWVTEMGRDLLGDNIPPDEINILKEGKDYGWPYCYGKKIQDTAFNNSADAKTRCENSEASYIDLQAHSAPLGLAFVPINSGWPKDYENNVLVAYHGSWNRSVPTGYKVVRFKLDKQGQVLGQEDFITGWLTNNENALGRPVDILLGVDGFMYITDDKAGVIYRVAPAINDSL